VEKHNHLKMHRWLREIRPIMHLALPIMSGMASQMLIGLADTIMLGRVGVVPLAASSFVNTLAHLPFLFSLGLLTSIAVVTSQTYGAERSDDLGEVLRHSLMVSLVVGILTALVVAALYPFRFRFGQPAEVARESGVYLLLLAVSLVPAILVQGCKHFSEAVNRPWAPACLLFAGVLLNIFFNWLLIYGHWGAPALGLEGAGWATLISRLLMALAFLVYIFYSPVMRNYHPQRWKNAWAMQYVRQLLALGWPPAAQHLLEIGAFSFAAIMVGWIHAEAIAAHQIAISCASMSFMFALGIGMAGCIRVGHSYGAGQMKRMRRIGFLSIGMAAFVMSLFGLLFMTCGKLIASYFVKSFPVVQLATHLLFFAALFQVADGIQISSISVLRGLGDVRMPIFVTSFAYWLVALPLGYLLAFPAKMGAAGIWIGLAAGLGVSAVALSWRFNHQSGRLISRQGKM
jgi:MATE family multidrug resistance protein